MTETASTQSYTISESVPGTNAWGESPWVRNWRDGTSPTTTVWRNQTVRQGPPRPVGTASAAFHECRLAPKDHRDITADLQRDIERGALQAGDLEILGDPALT